MVQDRVILCPGAHGRHGLQYRQCRTAGGDDRPNCARDRVDGLEPHRVVALDYGPIMAQPKTADVTVRDVDADSWRDVAALRVHEDQRAFVAEPLYYLALCSYSIWRPLAIVADGTVVGFLMWAIDDDDGSCWLGGILVDRAQQRQGHGRAAVRAAMSMLADRTGATAFALSYQAANVVARRLYASLGFVETGEVEGDEVVARYRPERAV